MIRLLVKRILRKRVSLCVIRLLAKRILRKRVSLCVIRLLAKRILGKWVSLCVIRLLKIKHRLLEALINFKEMPNHLFGQQL